MRLNKDQIPWVVSVDKVYLGRFLDIRDYEREQIIEAGVDVIIQTTKQKRLFTNQQIREIGRKNKKFYKSHTGGKDYYLISYPIMEGVQIEVL